MRVTGRLEVYVGNELVRSVDNLVVDTGLEYIASLIANQTTYAGDYLAIGTGSTAAASTDTSLEAEVGTRVQGSLSANSASFVVDGTFEPNNPATQQVIAEAGLLTAATGGTMIARTTFTAVTKPAPDGLRIVWTITVS